MKAILFIIGLSLIIFSCHNIKDEYVDALKASLESNDELAKELKFDREEREKYFNSKMLLLKAGGTDTSTYDSSISYQRIQACKKDVQDCNRKVDSLKKLMH